MKKTGLVGRAGVASVALVFAATLAACGSSGGGGGSSAPAGGSSAPSAADTGAAGALPGKGKPTFTLGDKNFSEQYLLGALYQQALVRQGYTVKLKENLGSSEIADKALQANKIDGIPEYTGVIYTELAGLGDRPKSAEATLAGATKYEKGRGFTVLDATPFQDADGLAVLKDYASKNSLVNIGDMKKVKSFTYAGPPENATRFQGVKGLKSAYGLNNFTFKPIAIGAQYQAIDQHKVDAIAIFTTDGQLAGGKYTVLKDTEGIFGFQQVVPVINAKKLAQMGPAFSETCNKLSALLTTDAIVALNKLVQIDKKDPAVVAKAFLDANADALKLN